MAINVVLHNPQSGELKPVKVGWSWALFFLSPVFGIPLFKRKLNTWGFVFLAINAVGLVCQIMTKNPAAQLLLVLVNLLTFGLMIFLGIKGNEMTAKNYLALGWKFAEPDSQMTQFAKMKWQIFEPSPLSPPLPASQA